MTTDPLHSAPSCSKCGLAIPSDTPLGLCPRCVLADAAASTESNIPQTPATSSTDIRAVREAFPQLEILECIGQGGMGVVFKARQPKLDREVALKLLPTSSEQDPAFAERFNREARMLARLHHANIVTVFDFGEAGNFFYLLMEYVDGVNLRQAMQAGRFSPAEALTLVPQICAALQYAHEEGILHRDIKPENILLDARGRVKIADFGIAKLVGESTAHFTLTASGARLGTPTYMAPEQIEKPAEVDHRADIYSLGVVFYELLTGELPIGRFAAPSEKTPLDQRVDHIVLRALAKEKELRQQSAQEMQKQVETVAQTPPPTATEASVSSAAPHAGSTHERHASPPISGVPPQDRRRWKSIIGPGIAIVISISAIAFFTVIGQFTGAIAGASLLAAAISAVFSNQPWARTLSRVALILLLFSLGALAINSWPFHPRRTPVAGLMILWLVVVAVAASTHFVLKRIPALSNSSSTRSGKSHRWGRTFFLLGLGLNVLFILFPRTSPTQQFIAQHQPNESRIAPPSIAGSPFSGLPSDAPAGTLVAHVELRALYADAARLSLVLWSNGVPFALPQSSVVVDPKVGRPNHETATPVSAFSTWWLRRSLQPGGWEIAQAVPPGAQPRVAPFTLPENIQLDSAPNVVAVQWEPGDRLRRWLFLEPADIQSLQSSAAPPKPLWGISVEISSNATDGEDAPPIVTVGDRPGKPSRAASSPPPNAVADVQAQLFNAHLNHISLIGRLHDLPEGCALVATLLTPNGIEETHMTDVSKRPNTGEYMDLVASWKLPPNWPDSSLGLVVADLQTNMVRSVRSTRRISEGNPWEVFSLGSGSERVVAYLHLRRNPAELSPTPSIHAEIHPQLATNSITGNQTHLILVYKSSLPANLELLPRIRSTDGSESDAGVRSSVMIDSSGIRRGSSATWSLPPSFQGAPAAAALAQLESCIDRSPISIPPPGARWTAFSATNAEGKIVLGYFEVRKKNEN